MGYEKRQCSHKNLFFGTGSNTNHFRRRKGGNLLALLKDGQGLVQTWLISSRNSTDVLYQWQERRLGTRAR